MPLLQLTRHIALWISRGFAGESFSISQISSSLQALNCAVYFCMYMIIARSFDHFAQPQVYLRLFFLLNDVRRLSHDHRRITRHPNQSWIALLQHYSIASHHTAHTDLFPIFTPQCDPGYCPMHFPQVRCVQCSMFAMRKIIITDSPDSVYSSPKWQRRIVNFAVWSSSVMWFIYCIGRHILYIYKYISSHWRGDLSWQLASPQVNGKCVYVCVCVRWG